MTRRNPLPPQLAAGPFSIQEAGVAGVPRSRVRAADLTAPFRGVRAPAGTDDFESLCVAYAAKMRPDQHFSHVTAARIYGIPLPSTLERRRDLDVTSSSQAPRAHGVIGHEGTPSGIRAVRGLWVPPPETVWLQLAALLSVDDLVVAGDHLVRRRNPLSTLARIHAAVVAAAGMRGIRVARAAAADIRAGTDSPMETRMRLVIVRAGLPEPVIGFIIRDGKGDYLGKPDLAYVAERIGIEYEGDHHRERPVFLDDIERRELMQEAAWHVIRVTSEHVLRHPDWLADRVARALAARSR